MEKRVWEAADGLPKSLNRLGNDIACLAIDKKYVTAQEIKDTANDMVDKHWREYAPILRPFLEELIKNEAAIVLLRYLYEAGIGNIHHIQNIEENLKNMRLKSGERIEQYHIRDSLNQLVRLNFLFLSGPPENIVFVADPTMAHCLGVALRAPERYLQLYQIRNAEEITNSFPTENGLESEPE